MNQFKAGDVVRYGSGSTALAKLSTPHAGGWHADQCMGGSVYVSTCNLREPDADDMAMWNAKQAENRKRWAGDKARHDALTGKGLSFSALRAVNVVRCDKAFFPFESKDGPWWGNAMAGECGEACNVVKKIDRDGDTPELRAMLAEELADLITYADLLAARFDIDLGAAVVAKFNKVSEKRGCDIRLPEAT